MPETMIVRPRGGGKTTEIIKHAAKNFSYIVCMSVKECDRVAAQAREMKVDIPFPITFQELTESRWHPAGVKSLAIDNAEMLLQQLCRGKMSAFTINSEATDD